MTGSETPDYRANEDCVENDFIISDQFGLTVNNDRRFYYKSDGMEKYKHVANKEAKKEYIELIKNFRKQ